MTPDTILAKAEFDAFLKQYTVYKVLRENNRFNIGTESIRLSIQDDREFCRFIYYKGSRAGGVILRNNTIKHLFVYPEFDPHLLEIMKVLHEKAAENADPEKGIACLPSNSYQAVNFGKLEYQTVRKLRCMIGPLKSMGWKAPAGFLFRKPTVRDSKLLAKLFYEANLGEPWHQPVTMEHFTWGVDMYFDPEKTMSYKEVSTICIEEKSGEAVGACLISMDEGYPFVFDLHVLADYRRKGIALGMMKRAISKTAGNNDFMRLFVIDGNPAQHLYEKLGFIAGSPLFIMKYMPSAND